MSDWTKAEIAAARAIALSVYEDDFDTLPEYSIMRASYLQQARDAINAALPYLTDKAPRP